jgi:uncharacterized protein (TIGR00725 family)
MTERAAYVAVCGASNATAQEAQWAEEIGRRLARSGAVVITGGLGGVMAAAAKGATDAGGTALGILPSDRHDDASPHNTLTVPTGLGEARNALIVRTADVVIAVGGEFVTLSEIALALRTGKPVIALGSWELERPGLEIPVRQVRSAEEAVTAALDAV